MTDEQARIRANDARTLLDNSLFKEAFQQVGAYIESQAMSCPPDDKERCARIIISKQLLAAIRRELVRVVEEGEFAAVRISEIEKRNKLKEFLR